ADEELVCEGDMTARSHKARDRADDRPRARVHEMVVVVLDVRVGHFSSLRSPLGRARASWSPISLRDPRPASPARAAGRMNRTAWWGCDRSALRRLPTKGRHVKT